ncbi:family 10 glycosylhydrolase [Rhodocytophaga rosea]|uniref:Family 10 glycosylhydrolase n=1 Tax=Rhodocytophaga rosea TaxID=2704465 RepID=A0A6C0GC64_9BACT|nr:alpha-amylase family protein [Rhodocytophaga rosea]QHT65569.1 family 10 glycosylhydrolase [Rhodocytophaga rosea]
MNYRCCTFLLFLLFCFSTSIAQKQAVSSAQSQDKWPASLSWWKPNNLRVIQTNLPAYEAATLHPDSLLKDLTDFSANTLIINAGGIMAFYPTKLDFQYINPYMKPSMLGDVIKKCHQQGIRVMVRFDFSRVHESIFKQHPDWCYISPKGERIINTDMYVVSINAPYVQDRAFRIIEEVIDLYPVDGIFLNMPGYQVNNPYEGKYHGIDQNDYDKKRFAEYSKGLALPVEENKADPVFQKYQEFKKYTTSDWSQRLHKLVKSKNPQIAICTYMDQYVDIIRHESQTNSLPYWPYMSSDNVSNAVNSYPEHVISNASIQQISFQSRYNAVEPEETAIRLYENMANGSGLDVSLMGDLRGYEDERNFEVIKKVYALHKKNEPYFGKYISVANIAVIAPGTWPSGEAMQEYRGIQLMLKEAHIPFDIIEDAQIGNLPEKIKQYKLLVLPEITYLNDKSIQVLKQASQQGTHLIATNRTLFNDEKVLFELFGAKIINKDHEGSGFYLNPENKEVFKRFDKQKMLFWKFNLGLYDLSAADSRFLPILTKGRPGPPEIIGGHDPSGYYAMGVKNHNQSKSVILPINLGKLYYLHGYEQHKNILLDVIDHIFPEATQLIQTNAPARVEVILQKYIKNTPKKLLKKSEDGMILHLINLTGFSGNTYFEPLPVNNLTFRIRSDIRPSKLFSMVAERPLVFTWKDGFLEFTVNTLGAYEGIVIDK